MNECNAMRLALACSVLGIILLFLFSSWAEQSSAPVNINELSLDNVGSGVKVCGNPTSQRTSKGHLFFSLDDGTGGINIVVFNTTAGRMNISLAALETASPVCALGQLEEYPPGSGGLELVAKKVFLE